MATPTPTPMWIGVCSMYLKQLNLMDRYTRLYDEMPFQTKHDYENRMDVFDNFMDCLEAKKEIEDELDELWSIKDGRT